MNKLLTGLSAVLLATVALPTLAVDVGVSIGINQPGVYGRVDIGRVPAPPVLVYPQPMVIVPTPVAVQRQPIYLHVPPGHARDWRRHCGRYQACGQPVYFVQERWYNDHYQRGPKAQHSGKPDKRHHGDKRDDKRDDKHGGKHDNKHGNKHGDKH